MDSNKKFLSLQPLERVYVEKPSFSFLYKGFLHIFEILKKLYPHTADPSLVFKDYEKSLLSKACEGNAFTIPIQRVLFAFDSISETKLLLLTAGRASAFLLRETSLRTNFGRT